MKLPHHHPDPQVRSIAAAISHACCVLSEDHQSVESQSIARANIVKMKDRLRGMGVVL